jgi:hypothetical protein
MNQIIGKLRFPEFTGIKCSMMPFVQGDPESLPAKYHPYSEAVKTLVLEPGKIGFLTIDEAFVTAGKSQRGYNSANAKRNVHIEVGHRDGLNFWGGGGGGWGRGMGTILESKTKVLIANSLSYTCRFWDKQELDYTRDGDLSAYLDRYNEDDGILMQSGDVAEIGIFTPHECLPQRKSGNRQFIRVVGVGVHGREDYFTVNPLVTL